MAAVARRLLLKPGVGERLLASKLQFLNGTATRRPGLALRILTGRDADPLTLLDNDVFQEEPTNLDVERVRVRYAARTVYVSERHVRDVDYIIEAWQQEDARRLTRSAVVRRAVEYLRAAVEADPAQFLLEND
jgi:hypothetical protein